MRKSVKWIAAGAVLATLGLVGTAAYAQRWHEGGHERGHGRMGAGQGYMQGHGGSDRGWGGMRGHDMQGHGMQGRGMHREGMQGRGMRPGGQFGMMADPAGRLASLKTELAIKPEQTAAWDAYSKVVTETAADRRNRRDNVDRDAVRKMEPKDREAFRTAMMKQRDEEQAKLKAAAETLIATLDDTQKAKARGALPGLAQTSEGSGMRHGMMSGHGMGHSRGFR
jgi:hypothetical protein